jgi:hypothetical protein
MIIGIGDIARILKDRDGAIFFASGVSNSQCTDKNEFQREIDLFNDVLSNHNGESFFYFSTMSIYLKSSPYIAHKLRMENFVKLSYPNYNIIRIGNITFGKNSNTFINYFRNCIVNGLPYEVRDEYKYLIHEKELRLLTDNLPLIGRNEISVTGRIVKVQDIVNELLNEQG